MTTFQVVPEPNELGWRSLFGAWYFEDAIKLRPNLTLRVGLRHEFTTGWNEVSGRAATTSPTQWVLVTDAACRQFAFTRRTTRRSCSARRGLAWDPFGNGKTAVRAGFGTYYSLIDDLSFLLNSLPPYNGSASFIGSSLFSHHAGDSQRAVPPSCGPGVPTPCTTYAPQGIQADAKTPTVRSGISRSSSS